MAKNDREKKSFIGKLAKELEIKKESPEDLTDTQKLKKIRQENSALKDRKRLITKSQKRQIEKNKKRKYKEEKKKKSDPTEETSETDKKEQKQSKRVSDEPEILVTRSRMNKKIVILPLILILIASLFFAFSGKDHYSKEELYVKLNESIREKNPVLLNKILDVKDYEAKSDDFEAYLELLINHDEYREKILQEVYLQSNSSGNDNYSIRMKETGRRKVFLKGYRLEIDPIKVQNNSEDVIIKRKDKKIDLENLDHQLMPGRYILEKKEEFLIIQEVKDLYPLDTNLVELELNEEQGKIANDTIDITGGDSNLKLRSNEDGIIFVNGKNTELTIEEFNEKTKRLAKGDTIRLVTSLPWGYAFSKEYVYNNENTTDLAIEYVNDTSKKLFTNLIKETVYNDKIAYEKNDSSALTSLTGKALARDEAWIDMNIHYGNIYLRDYYYMLIDYNNMEITKKRDGYEAYLGGFLNYREYKYNPEYDEKPTDEDYKVFEDAKRGFHFEYNEDREQWLVNTWGTTFRRLDRENTTKIDFD